MDEIKFVFVELLKGLGLALGGVLAVKAITALGGREQTEPAVKRRPWRWLRGALYTILLMLVGAGAWIVGHDVAAELYYTASKGDLDRRQFPRACTNAQQAVDMRPRVLRYWRVLERSKLSLGQFNAVLSDEPAVRALSSGGLDETDAMQFAFARFFLGQYDQAIDLAMQVTRTNPYYAPPYVLAGMAYIGEKKYADAERSYLAVLQMNPTNENAVRGLAQAYFLSGDRDRAVKVLQATKTFPFSEEARRGFAELERVYSQPPAGHSTASPDPPTSDALPPRDQPARTGDKP